MQIEKSGFKLNPNPLETNDNTKDAKDDINRIFTIDDLDPWIDSSIACQEEISTEKSSQHISDAWQGIK